VTTTDAPPPADDLVIPERSRGTHRRRRIIVAAAVIVILATGGGVLTATLWHPSNPAPTASAPTPATAAVERRTIAAQQQVSGTLGYAGDLDVIGQLSGTITALPTPGTVVEPGGILYRVDGKPVVLLAGDTPAWRAFEWGTTGVDAQQLNAALVELGYADGLDIDPECDQITWRSQQAIKRFQAAFGLRESGTLDFGQVVFLPSAVRVTATSATLGAPAGAGQTIIEGTSTTPQVEAEVPVSLLAHVKVGDAVAVTLPDLTTASGTVTDVGAVATQKESGSATVPVRAALTDPGTAAGLDQAPVLVAITTETVEDVLTVPVTALLALSGGEYAVEVIDTGGDSHLVTVELGLFDSAGGLVQVSGDGLRAGQRVVVPAA